MPKHHYYYIYDFRGLFRDIVQPAIRCEQPHISNSEEWAPHTKTAGVFLHHSMNNEIDAYGTSPRVVTLNWNDGNVQRKPDRTIGC